MTKTFGEYIKVTFADENAAITHFENLAPAYQPTDPDYWALTSQGLALLLLTNFCNERVITDKAEVFAQKLDLTFVGAANAYVRGVKPLETLFAQVKTGVQEVETVAEDYTDAGQSAGTGSATSKQVNVMTEGTSNTSGSTSMTRDRDETRTRKAYAPDALNAILEKVEALKADFLKAFDKMWLSIYTM